MTILISRRRKCPDVRLWRAADPIDGRPEPVRGAAQCSLRRILCFYSPTGIEWGYRGSGPADLALSIMSHCLPQLCDGLPRVVLCHGRCSRVAWDCHHAFERSFVSQVPPIGGTILGCLVDAWLDGALEIWIARREEGWVGFGLDTDPKKPGV